MKNIQRVEEIQKAVQLVRDSIEGKEVTASELRNALVNTCILADSLMKENAKLKATAKKYSIKEKKRTEMYLPFFAK
ncbi:hypothetical protein RRV45_15290 [Bacillus sp. DTU_2020_1000418_1_SI_GHA_SEK_038]|uniref:hypothetical protein n=1 Tax=Bacillus sp. DTU_2020_1000418_1_SI_GHA_SEK_038 TaxID=3077585 RepID=UPI0028EDC31B|nr:hypothetical protein [Bacillus sp. DTU_2020_1000418_1_SI_GHA_SEK_038]WNS74274.1 hypothetical protein RRV45_15290 [Bacillus sp. DTU_2020_1000418_1_SI_GHA_SEK_038]